MRAVPLFFVPYLVCLPGHKSILDCSGLQGVDATTANSTTITSTTNLQITKK